MGRIFASIRYNLTSLVRFSGRDTRLQFWPYVIILYLVAMIADFAIMIPPLVEMMMRIQRSIAENPERLPTGGYGPGAQVLPPEFMPDLSGIMLPLAAINILFMLLVAAAAVRRLHDRDMTGLWALLPVPFIVVGQMIAPRIFATFSGAAPLDPTTWSLAMLNGILSWAALILLIVFLAVEGTRGPNRFGPDPGGAPG